MADVKLTASQKAVVEDRGGALLVSAAAGSGKTKVLVDRLLRQICDPVSPKNIDEFLVITYTKAAAAELRMKIAQALSQRLAEDPDNRHLQRQLHRIYLAEISTVHAFCSGLLRTYAHLLDLPADFRVAEEAESRALQDKVLTGLLEQSYADLETDPEFRAMVDTFGYGRDDRRLPEAVRMAHTQMRCRADMEGWLEDNLRALEISRYEDISQTPWGRYLLEEYQIFLHHSKDKMKAALSEMARYPRMEKGLSKVFRENIAQLEALCACTTWDEFCANRITSFGRVGAVRDPEDSAVKERLAQVRTLIWTELKKRQELFCADSASQMKDLAHTAAGTQALLRFAKRFDEAYGAEKRQRKLMDFSDLEHSAIRLLTDRYTGKPTTVAREISLRYAEIMVDEYQDSNQVQDTIFEAVSRNGRNRFMVGDVKQSIYRFRLAEPEIFLRKYDAYPGHEAAEDGQPRKILLSENFRSRPEILSACNDVFRLVMRKSVGDLDYGDAEALRPGRPYPPMEGIPVELHCLTGSGDMGDKRDLEAEYVAERIRAMLDEGTPVTDGDGTRPVRPSDIVILMRSLSSSAGAYQAALRRYNIPSVSDRGGSLLDTSEVQILVAILQIIDNPHQDVPLICAMASPVFGFTPDELAVPRMENRKDDYYDTIRTAADPGTKLHRFLQTLQSLREDSTWMNLHELVDSVLRRTNLMAVFSSMPDGASRERNLTAFRSYVVNFESGGSKALIQLLRHLEELRTSGSQLPLPKTSAENAVTLMTVHSSKGLEFPVVFLCDLSRKFNLSDMQDAILVDGELSVGCNRIDQQRYIRYPTVAKQAIVRKKTAGAVSEELRILYVAMTRPKDRLIMTYYSKNLLTELKNINSQLTMPLSDDLCASARCPGRWILMAALCRTEAGELLSQVGYNDVSQVWQYPWKITLHDLSQEDETVAASSAETSTAAESLPVRLLHPDYPHREACLIPAKLTATQLKGRVIDRETAELAAETLKPSPAVFRQPGFRPKGLTAAERGTATHLFLQFADYAACSTTEGLERELVRMERDAFLTTDQVQAVSRSQVLQFFASELGQWLLKQPSVRREFKFSLLVDAGKWYPEAAGEQTMLQGVVDCFVLQSDGITILDFKTDRTPNPERYRPQMEAYSQALSAIYGLPVKARILYFFSTGSAISL